VSRRRVENGIAALVASVPFVLRLEVMHPERPIETRQIPRNIFFDFTFDGVGD
jgi:hypothetical protein